MRWSLRLVVVSLVFVATACAAPPATPVQPPAQSGSTAGGAATGPDAGPLGALYEAARREGEVIVEGADTAESMQPIIDRFQQKYPGIRVSYSNRTPGETVERIVAEAAVGRTGVDASRSSIRTVLPLADRGLMMRADWKALAPDLPDEAIMLDGQFVASFHQPNVMVYNTNLLSPAELPKQWEDVLDPKWRNRRMILDARGVGLEHIVLAWGDERGYDFIAKLKAQNPILVPRSAVSIERVAAGEAPLGGSTFPSVFEYMDQGAPIRWVPLEQYGVSTFGLFVSERAPHPNAGQLWVAFLLSPEGRRLMEETNYAAFVFPGSNTRMERELREANVRLVFTEDSEEKARRRGEIAVEIQRLLGGLR